MNASKLMGQSRNTFAVTVRLAMDSSLWNGFAGQGKRHVERGWDGAVDYVGADTQPVRCQSRVADPGLQVAVAAQNSISCEIPG